MFTDAHEAAKWLIDTLEKRSRDAGVTLYISNYAAADGKAIYSTNRDGLKSVYFRVITDGPRWSLRVSDHFSSTATDDTVYPSQVESVADEIMKAIDR